MFKQLEKAINSKSLNCSKCIIIANVRNPEKSDSTYKLSKDLTINTKSAEHKKSCDKPNKLQDKRRKTFEFIKRTANQHGIKSELFDISALNINFNNSVKGFSSNCFEFESFLCQLLL